jgi:CRP/FNR family cyclic AMP-dependent transcriptional regulator
MTYPPDILEVFSQTEDHQDFPAGQAIMHEGDTGDVMYVVKSGEVELRVGDQYLATVEAGGILGEMALVDQGPRSATALARTDCELVPIDREQFLFFLRLIPGFALEVMRVMAERLRRTDRLLVTGREEPEVSPPEPES